MPASTSLNAYEGFDFAPSATLEEFSHAFARWEAPDRRLRRGRHRLELDDAIASLRRSVAAIEAFTDEQRSLSEAAQWLVDNFYVIERIRTQLAALLSGAALHGVPAYQKGVGGRR